jgi:predicted ABC-type sugar transport system permease subunit
MIGDDTTVFNGRECSKIGVSNSKVPLLLFIVLVVVPFFYFVLSLGISGSQAPLEEPTL